MDDQEVLFNSDLFSALSEKELNEVNGQSFTDIGRLESSKKVPLNNTSELDPSMSDTSEADRIKTKVAT